MRELMLTEGYMKRYVEPRGYDTKCPICGRALGVGDRVILTNNKNYNKYYCLECFYTEPREPLEPIPLTVFTHTRLYNLSNL